MIETQFPKLDDIDFAETRDALHGYAGILGDWLKSCRPKRKHWWHASLRPSLNGLTTGVVHAGLDFQIELNMRDSSLLVQTSIGEQFSESLHGQAVLDVALRVREFLIEAGIEERLIPDVTKYSESEFSGYSAETAYKLALALNAVSISMQALRAAVHEETSPIQVWPHHFDLSMLWLPGEKIPGQDPADEENSDKQMNFGFTFGDEGVEEPYFYVTAYPSPEELSKLTLPAGAVWQTDGFSGAVLTYDALMKSDNPHRYLLDLWTKLLAAGRKHMLSVAVGE